MVKYRRREVAGVAALAGHIPGRPVVWIRRSVRFRSAVVLVTGQKESTSGSGMLAKADTSQSLRFENSRLA